MKNINTLLVFGNLYHINQEMSCTYRASIVFRMIHKKMCGNLYVPLKTQLNQTINDKT
jgi:hypothetical protein